MLELQKSGERYYYSVLSNPVPRALKFQQFSRYVSAVAKGGTVLDYGAGDRPLEDYLLTRFDAYVAADYLPANAAHTRRPDIEINDEGVDLPDESVECISCTEVLEHVYKPHEALAEMYRVLKPGGAVIGTVPFAIGEHETPYDFHRYTSFCLRKMFEDAGFEVVSLDYVGDTVGVAAVSLSRVLGIVTKAVNKLKLKPLIFVAQLAARTPELIYYLFLKLGLDPGKVGFYKSYPLGFGFHVVKSPAS